MASLVIDPWNIYNIVLYWETSDLCSTYPYRPSRFYTSNWRTWRLIRLDIQLSLIFIYE